MIGRHVGAILALVFITINCDPKVTDPPPTEGTIRAHITGAINASVELSATFSLGGYLSTHTKAEIDNYDSTGPVHQLLLQILGSVSPQPGVYPLEPRFFMGGDSTGNTATVWYGDDFYIAESGTLTITYAPDRWWPYDSPSGKHVDGSFDFTAVYWCTGVCRTLPDTFGPDLPRIHVTGEFSARPTEPVPAL